MSKKNITIAMSLLIHGEAVRFNRGNKIVDGFDFKHMKGYKEEVYPYVSSQCYKKYWRESLEEPLSPITRAKVNQAYTDGNPIQFIDDDLFGYMIAGAKDTQEDLEQAKDIQEYSEQTENLEISSTEKEEEKNEETSNLFTMDDMKEAKSLLKKIFEPKNAKEQTISPQILEMIGQEERKKLEEGRKAKVSDEHKEILMDALNRYPNKKLLEESYPKELRKKTKRETTKRTAPIRMHALLSFSGIKTAKDFQTLSRDVSYTGENSVINPSSLGIYSAWLRTRILIEYSRIGKFYVGRNMDILEQQVKDEESKGKDVHIQKEPNPYSRNQEEVMFIQLNDSERLARLQSALKALANIGNKQGPASGALHDGSLRAKGFIAGIMSCADSPFDYIWKGTEDLPFLDTDILVKSIQDWKDLFLSPKIYIGLPLNLDSEAKRNAIREDVRKMMFDETNKIPFETIIDTPRQALLRFSKEVADEIQNKEEIKG